MIVSEKRSCPLCGHRTSNIILEFKISSFDKLHDQHQFSSCMKCGFVYNSDIHFENVLAFYESNDDYLNENAAGSGGTGASDLFRYDIYLKILKNAKLSMESQIVDVGCAKGGFVKYLNQEGFSKASGIELDRALVDKAKGQGIPVQLGAIDSFPHLSNSIDCVCAFHVLEHLFDIESSITEIHRILVNDGLCLVEVPNAGNYSGGRTFPHFWTLIKEHINHFDEYSLSATFSKGGFEVIGCFHQIIPYDNSDFGYPSLMLLLRKNKGNKNLSFNTFRTAEQIKKYFKKSNNQLARLITIFQKWRNENRSVVIWGCSLELQILLSFTCLEQCSIVAIIDKNPLKQGKIIHDIAVRGPELLESITDEGVVLVCSILHSANIVKELKTLAPQLEYETITE